MSAVYTVRLALLQSTSPAPVAAYTVPAGMVVVVRDIIMRVVDSSMPVNPAVWIASGADVGTLLLIPAPEKDVLYSWQGRQVAEAGDQLMVAPRGKEVQFAVTGYLLSSG